MYRLPPTGGVVMLGSFIVDNLFFTLFGLLLISIILFRISRFLIRKVTYYK